MGKIALRQWEKVGFRIYRLATKRANAVHKGNDTTSAIFQPDSLFR